MRSGLTRCLIEMNTHSRLSIWAKVNLLAKPQAGQADTLALSFVPAKKLVIILSLFQPEKSKQSPQFANSEQVVKFRIDPFLSLALSIFSLAALTLTRAVGERWSPSCGQVRG